MASGWLVMLRRAKIGKATGWFSLGQDLMYLERRVQAHAWGRPVTKKNGTGKRPWNWRKANSCLDSVMMDWIRIWPTARLSSCRNERAEGWEREREMGKAIVSASQSRSSRVSPNYTTHQVEETCNTWFSPGSREMVEINELADILVRVLRREEDGKGRRIDDDSEFSSMQKRRRRSPRLNVLLLTLTMTAHLIFALLWSLSAQQVRKDLCMTGFLLSKVT